MARARSPNYPAIGLSEAIDRITKVHGAQHQAPEPREVVAQHMGYGGLNGAALKTLSALIKYGLLIKTGKDELKVSDRAMMILFPENPKEREEAIRDAATAPALFAHISERWEGKSPSDESLRSYLSRRDFAQSAIGGVIQSYRETIDLVTRESDGYDSPSNGEPMEEPMPRTIPVGMATETDSAGSVGAVMGSDPIRMAILSDRIDVSASLKTPAQIDELIRRLNAVKIIITPIHGANSTEYPDTDEGRAAEKRDQEMKEEYYRDHGNEE